MPLGSSSLTGQGKLVAAYASVVVASLFIGYWAGVRSRSVASEPSYGTKGSTRFEPVDDSEGSETSSAVGDGNIASIRVSQDEECKLALIVRTDLGMSPGKIAAQCSHATLACYKSLLSTNSLLLKQWERTGQTKIALRCKDENELLLLQAQAQSLNLCARSIQDAGRTQIAAGSRTVLGIAGPTRLINQVTGKLRLL